MNLFGQSSKPIFLQLNATVDILGNIKILQFEGKLDNLQNSRDSANFSNATLYKVINDCKNAIDAINLLSKEGWIFIAAVPINKDENSRPNSPFIAYYFRKD